jgi:L-alanine-DL-glutamate epimerase-like enolase superfamily enzyme
MEMHNTSRLQITDVRLIPLKTLREVGTLEPAWDPGGRLHFAIGGGAYVEVHTDAGLTGIGPGCAPDLVPTIKAHLVGKDPFDVEQHVATLRYYAQGVPYRGPAGVDIALWDLIGKACDQPLYKLWGGAKDKVMPYASLMQLATPDERARQATQLLHDGWKALKIRLHHATLRQDIETVAKVRAAVGDRMAIMVDANQAQSSGHWQPGIRWDFLRAVETARELQQLQCAWLEEPLPRYAFQQLAALRQRVELPIAGGENNVGVHEFLRMLQEEVYDILQPESLVLEGISALRKIGVLAEAFGKQIVPHHGAWHLGVMAHLHFVASCPHAPYLEILHDPPIGDYRHGFAILQDPPTVDAEGYIQVPQGAGLGVEIHPEFVEQAS